MKIGPICGGTQDDVVERDAGSARPRLFGGIQQKYQAHPAGNVNGALDERHVIALERGVELERGQRCAKSEHHPFPPAELGAEGAFLIVFAHRLLDGLRVDCLGLRWFVTAVAHDASPLSERHDLDVRWGRAAWSDNFSPADPAL